MAEDSTMAMWKKISLIVGTCIGIITLLGLIGTMLTKENCRRLDAVEPAVKTLQAEKVGKEVFDIEVQYLKESSVQQTQYLKQQDNALRRLEIRFGTFREENYSEPTPPVSRRKTPATDPK